MYRAPLERKWFEKMNPPKHNLTTAIERLCSICNRRAKTEYCEYHEEASSQVKSAFNKWQAALGNLTWERYLERILELDETGDWAKEVAKRELEASRTSTVEIGSGEQINHGS